jgi:hypothetical protein
MDAALPDSGGVLTSLYARGYMWGIATRQEAV